MTKKRILDIIEEQLENNINQLTQSLESFKSASNLDEGDTIDPDDMSKQSEYKEMQMRMQIQLDQANSHLTRLHELAAKDHSITEIGALVETNAHYLFIGVSLANMHVDGKELLGISPESPAYLSIKGKGPGDTFQLGKEEYSILKVY